MGKPSRDGVSELRKALQRLNDANKVKVMRVAATQIAVDNEDKADQELHEARKAVESALDRMDISSPGNAGYGERIRWVLREIVRGG